MMFSRLIDDINAAGLCVHGIEVRHGGEVIERHFFHEDKPYPVYSATKSVTSAAVMAAADDGRLSLDDKLYIYLDTKYMPLMKDEFKTLSFRDFMTMTAAPYPFRPEGDDWIKSILALDVDYSDRAHHYSNIPAYLVGAACENAVGEPLMGYIMRKLFAPMGIPEPEYRRSPEGHFYGATGMTLSLENFGRLGQFFADKGCYDGRQLISCALIEDATTEKVRTKSGGYGYFFPTDSLGFCIRGKWGQRSMVCTEKNLVVTCLADLPKRSDELYGLLDNYINNA